MKFTVPFALLLLCPSIAATDAWGSDACEYDSELSVSLLQRHVRTGTTTRKKPRTYRSDDVGAVAQALTSEIDDALEQAVDDEALEQATAKNMKNTRSQINSVGAGHVSSGNSPTLVVDVPVVKVLEAPMTQKIPIVVEEEEEEEEEDGEEEEEDDDDNSDHSEASDHCVATLEKLLTNPSKLEKARKCEEQKGHSDRAIEALQKMDTDLAIKNIEKTFHQCGRISKQCSKELAPEEMLKIRLSGVTMEQKCADVAAEQDVDPDAKAAACQTKMGQGIIDTLLTGNVVDALDLAQDGLRKCNNIKHPCDFQLAPLLVGQLIQSQEEQGPQAEPLQPGDMLLSPADDFASLLNSVIRPSYYQALLLLQE